MHALSHRCPDIISFHVENFNLYDYNLQIFFYSFLFLKMSRLGTGLQSLCSTVKRKHKLLSRRERGVISCPPAHVVLFSLILSSQLFILRMPRNRTTQRVEDILTNFFFFFFFWLNFIYLKYYQQFNIMFFEAIFL